jgi:hypothetical protein
MFPQAKGDGMSPKAYDTDFYRNQQRGSLLSAEVVLPLIFHVVSPKIVVDYGCGVGAWLSIARRLGAERVIGFEGAWVKPEMLLDPAIELHTVDLERTPPIGKTDLAICLEVAEHLSSTVSANIVKALCASSDVVLFGAAIPGQEGRNHVNERPQSYWSTLFSDIGYDAFDIVRPVVWDDRQVDFWYAQNMLLYISERRKELYSQLSTSRPTLIDVVHPRLLYTKTFEGSTRERLRIASGLPREIVKSIRRRFSRFI